MAGATMAILPVLLVFIVLQKYIIRGVALSGLKG
jgi:multiple sugar transport system permease protein